MSAAKPRAEAFQSVSGPAVRTTNAGVYHCQSKRQAESLADTINRFDAAQLALGKKPCPECGGWMELVKASDGGQIEEPFLPIWPLRDQPLPRRIRPASFWACSGCEHCEEVAL